MKSYLLPIIVLSVFLLFFHLGTRPFLSSGEARAGEIALEMLTRGDIIIPYLNEEIILTKPPLFHWLIILCYKLFGISEFSCRFPSALSGILVIVLVYLLGKKFWDEKNGAIASLFLLTSPLFFWSARCARIDSLLLFFITASTYCFWMGYSKLSKKNYWFILWFLFMGFGMFSKGPVGIVIPLLIPMLFLLYIKKLYVLKNINWFWGFFVFSIIVSPWFILIYSLVSSYNTEMFFIQQNYVWFGGGGEWYKGYVYIPHLFIGFFPWSLALPMAFIFTWKDLRYKKDEKIVFLWIWIFVVFFVFGMFGKKVSRYILPLYPAVSLLTSYMVNDRKNMYRIFSLALTIICFFIILIVNFYSKIFEPELVLIAGKYINSLWISNIGLLMICLGLYGIKKCNFLIPLIMVFVLLVGFAVYVLPIERDYYSPKSFCEMLKIEVPEDAVLKSYKSWDNTIRYYLGRHVDIMDYEKELLRFLDKTEKVYCFMWQDVYNNLPEDIKKKALIIKGGYRVLDHKTVLVSNKL